MRGGREKYRSRSKQQQREVQWQGEIQYSKNHDKEQRAMIKLNKTQLKIFTKTWKNLNELFTEAKSATPNKERKIGKKKGKLCRTFHFWTEKRETFFPACPFQTLRKLN